MTVRRAIPLSSHTEGRVVSQQTQLQFTCSPPSPAGSFSLPHCVTAARAGQVGFAMNRETQLQFNVNVPPEPSNLRTQFRPTPSPVVVEKLPPRPSFLPWLHKPHPLPADRLALAVKLARRDLQRGLVQPPPDPQCPTTDRHHSTLTSGDHSSYPLGPTYIPPSPLVPPSYTTASPLGLGPPHSSLPRGGNRQTGDSRTEGSLPRCGNHQTGDGRTEGSLPRPVYMCSAKSACVRVKGSLPDGRKPASDGGRVLWEKDEEKEERKQKRAEEQAARNSRTIYSLRRQIEAAEREIQQLRGTGEARHTKKSRAVHRLAAAQRAAVRTLRPLLASSLPSPSIPPELPLLVQRLSLLSAQLRDTPTGTVTEEEESLDQLLGQVLQLQGSSKEDRPGTAVKRRSTIEARPRGRKSTARRNGVRAQQLRTRRSPIAHKQHSTGHTHFSRQTHSSLHKRKPPVNSLLRTVRVSMPHPPPVTPLPPHSLPAEESHPSHTSPPTKREQFHPPYPISSSGGQCSEFVFTEGGSSKASVGSSGIQVPPVDHAEGEGVGCPPQEASGPPASTEEMREPEVRGEGAMSSVKSPPAIGLATTSTQRKTDTVSDQIMDDLLQDTMEECQRVEHSARLEQAAQALLQSPDIEAMLERLVEIEQEEELIRQKWTSINYEDNEPPTHLMKGYCPPLTGQHPSHNLSPTVLSSIHHHREHYQHHLQLSGMDTGGGFDPWTLMERLADDILDELLLGVSSEVVDACNSYVEGMYSDEFLPPTHHK